MFSREEKIKMVDALKKVVPIMEKMTSDCCYVCIEIESLEDVNWIVKRNVKLYITHLLGGTGDCTTVWSWLINSGHVNFSELAKSYSWEQIRRMKKDYRIRWVKHMISEIEQTI
jgi:hypothetical protein